MHFRQSLACGSCSREGSRRQFVDNGERQQGGQPSRLGRRPRAPARAALCGRIPATTAKDHRDMCSLADGLPAEGRQPVCRSGEGWRRRARDEGGPVQLLRDRRLSQRRPLRAWKMVVRFVVRHPRQPTGRFLFRGARRPRSRGPVTLPSFRSLGIRHGSFVHRELRGVSCSPCSRCRSADLVGPDDARGHHDVREEHEGA